MIYRVNVYNNFPLYFVDETVFNANKEYYLGTLIVGTKLDAENKLVELRDTVLAQEKDRFSICATFVSGLDTTWRAIQDSDPEDTVCQVFDHTSGSYTQVNNKTEAHALNEQRKQEFITSIGLDKVYELEVLPILSVAGKVGINQQPISTGTQTL